MSQTVDDVPEMAPAAAREEPASPKLTHPIGFVGLGAMGLPMAAALMRAGHAVLAADRDIARLSLLADLGGAAAHTTPITAELGASCALVFLMLPGTVAVAEVTGSLAQGMSPGGMIVDLGQSDPTETRLLASVLLAKGLRLLDAPAIGDPAAAEAATLAFLIGGAEPDVAELLPYLQAMGQVTRHTGPTGSAHAAARG